MRRAALLVLVLAAAGAAGERVVAQFRLKNAPSETARGWIVEFDDDGFKFQRFGDARRVTVEWDALVEEDRVALRRQLKLDLSEEEKLGLVPGHRLHLKGGAQVEGLLVRVDPQGRHWLKRSGFVFPYPGDRVVRVEEVKLRDSRIYSEEEIYLRRMQKTPPRTATQHRDLADRMFDLGEFEKARRHYEEAVRMKPSLAARLKERLDELAVLGGDRELAETLRRVRHSYRLQKDYAAARAELDAFLEKHPERRAAVERVLADLNDREHGDKVRRFHLSEAEAARLARARSDSSPHWVSYGSGSFVVNKRARTGKSTRVSVRGNPNEWWQKQRDRKTRAAFLRAYAVERLPDLFEVVEVRVKPCRKCGGKGQVKNVSYQQTGAGHEWFETCPRCFGARRDRSVSYR